METLLIKTPQGALIPADEEQAEQLSRYKVGSLVRATTQEVRNGPFHRKFFSMLDVGFDAWEPEEKEYRGLPAQKNRVRFRKDCIIAAGFYEVTVDLNGDLKLNAKSIKFARMEQDEFEQVYSAVANVLLQRVLKNYTRDDLDQVVDQILGYV